MRIPFITLVSLSLFTLCSTCIQAELIFTDTFERTDGSSEKDSASNGWSTNSEGRAQGDKQVFLRDGTLVVEISPKANHAVSVKHDFALRDCSVAMKFKIGEGDRLGVNFNDPTLKTSHAGHVCSVRVTTKELSVADQMNGAMNLALKEQKEAGKNLETIKEAIAGTEAKTGIKLAPDQWHELNFDIKGDVVRVYVDSKFILEHQSPGFGHPTKANIALSIPKNVVVDDFQVWNKPGRK